MRFRRCYCTPLLCAVVLFPASVNADVTRSVDEETGLVSWRMSEGSFELELAQLLPDQTRAFFLARGFSQQIADRIATGCVMQTIGRNTAGKGASGAVEVNLKQWRMKHDNAEGPIKLKEQWDGEWPPGAVSEAARLAFRWATFPTQQRFEAGDFGWGMTSFGLPPGANFDLKVVWSDAGIQQQRWLKGVQCAEEQVFFREEH
ncbi:MAG: hypothetical protein ABFR19_06030 [Pseudomonadota bacterium]